MSSFQPDVRLSKRLSYLLRHGAAGAGLSMSPDGSVLIKDLQRVSGMRGVPLDKIKAVRSFHFSSVYTSSHNGIRNLPR